MRAAGRPGRGERARVAARVRELVASQPGGDLPAARADEPLPETGSWLPDAEFERHVPRHGAPARPARWRWDPGRRGVLALGLAVLVVVAATGWWLVSSRPRELPVSTSASDSASESASAPSSAAAPPSSSVPAAVSAAAAPLVVDVAGKVMRPGIYQLAPGARVYDAVRAAGGPRPGVSTVALNLAEPLHDGEQIVVGLPGPVAPDPGSAPSGSAGTGTIVDLNTSTLEQLETLPGVGPVLGQHILDWRAAHGRFTSIDQLREVSGIGDVRFAQLRPLVSI